MYKYKMFALIEVSRTAQALLVLAPTCLESADGSAVAKATSEFRSRTEANATRVLVLVVSIILEGCNN